EESEQHPANEGGDFHVTAPRRSRVNNRLLQSVDEVRCGEEKADALNGRVEIGERDRGARKENKRQPQKLIKDLSLLHGVGDAGDDETERAERDGANGDQDQDSRKTGQSMNMKDKACEQKLRENGRERESEVGNHAGTEHVRGGHRRHVEAAEDSLFAEHDQCGAESPEATHNVERHNGAEIKSAGCGNTFSENAKPQKKEAKGHDDAKEEKHFVAQGEADAHARECNQVCQSRSLLPVSSMKTSSSDGVKISRETSSL